jgi:hypothetical protein
MHDFAEQCMQYRREGVYTTREFGILDALKWKSQCTEGAKH